MHRLIKPARPLMSLRFRRMTTMASGHEDPDMLKRFNSVNREKIIGIAVVTFPIVLSFLAMALNRDRCSEEGPSGPDSYF